MHILKDLNKKVGGYNTILYWWRKCINQTDPRERIFHGLLLRADPPFPSPFAPPAKPVQQKQKKRKTFVHPRCPDLLCEATHAKTFMNKDIRCEYPGNSMRIVDNHLWINKDGLENSQTRPWRVVKNNLNDMTIMKAQEIFCRARQAEQTDEIIKFPDIHATPSNCADEVR